MNAAKSRELNKAAYYLTQRRYSDRTSQTYYNYIKYFFDYIEPKDPSTIVASDIQSYLSHIVEVKQVSATYQRLALFSIKFYYEQILGQQLSNRIHIIPKHGSAIPEILSKEEISCMIQKTENLKHKSILAITYSCGLRLSEVINLKISNIDSKNMVVWIKNAKGNKDRVIPLSKTVLLLLREYWKEYKPIEWLFEGATGDKYGRSSVQIIVR